MKVKLLTASGLFACLLLISLLVGAPSRPTFAAKPAPPPPLPPIRYRIHYWEAPGGGAVDQINGMNNSGQVAGWYIDVAGEQRAYLYDPAIDPTEAFDLETLVAGAGVPPGWKVASAVGISDVGVIVGYLAPLGSNSGPVRQGYFLDTNAPAPEIVPLPNWGDWDYTYAKDVNEHGDICGVFLNADGSAGTYFCNPFEAIGPYFLDGTFGGRPATLNNRITDQPAQVAGQLANGTPFRWTPETNALTTFPGLNNPAIYDINDSGTMCGAIEVTTTTKSGKKTTTTTTGYPLRLTALPPNVLNNSAFPAGSFSIARDINSTGDLLLAGSWMPFAGILYRDDWGAYGKYIEVNKLVVGTSADLTYWNSTWRFSFAINDRGPSGASEIAGIIGDRNYLLVPETAP